MSTTDNQAKKMFVLGGSGSESGIHSMNCLKVCFLIKKKKNMTESSCSKIFLFITNIWCKITIDLPKGSVK